MRNRTKKPTRLFLAGILALALVALVSATETGSSEAQQGAMQNCPQPGKWAIAAWDGDDGADAEQALGTCGEGAVAVAYSIDPYTQAWSRWFADRPDVSNLLTLNNMQGVMVLGGAQAPTAPASPTPSPTPTPTPTPTAAAAGGPPTDYLDTFHAAIDMSIEMDMFGMDFAVEGDFEAPDSCSCDATVSMLGIPLIDQQLIVIGNKAWIDTGDGWRETTPSDPEVADSLGMCPACPSFWEEFAFEAPPLPGEHETKNGVPAIHYTLAELYEAFAGIGLIPEELEGVSVDALDVWVAEDGKWLVCLDMEICVEAEAMEEFTGQLEGVDSVCMAMSIDITRANDSSIQVNAPLAGSSGSSAQQDAMQNCPLQGKWAISVWSGDDGTDAAQALATCGEGMVAVAYSIDPDTQVWSRWFAGRPDISNLTALDNMQGVMALGGTQAPTPTPTPTAPPGACVPQVPPEGQANLFHNPGLESGREPWCSLHPEEIPPFEVSQDFAHSGESSALLRMRVSAQEEGKAKVFYLVQEVMPEQFPELISGYYRVENWTKGTPKQYVQFVVIAFDATNLPGGYPNHQIRYPLAGISEEPFAIANAFFVFIGEEEPRIGQWVYFERNIKEDFEGLWGAAPEGFSKIRVLFEVRYDDKEAGLTPANGDVYYDDLYMGPASENPNRAASLASAS